MIRAVLITAALALSLASCKSDESSRAEVEKVFELYAEAVGSSD